MECHDCGAFEDNNVLVLSAVADLVRDGQYPVNIMGQIQEAMCKRMNCGNLDTEFERHIKRSAQSLLQSGELSADLADKLGFSFECHSGVWSVY